MYEPFDFTPKLLSVTTPRTTKKTAKIRSNLHTGQYAGSVSPDHGQALLEALSLPGVTRHTSKFFCETTQKRGSARAINTSSLNCIWLKVVIALVRNVAEMNEIRRNSGLKKRMTFFDKFMKIFLASVLNVQVSVANVQGSVSNFIYKSRISLPAAPSPRGALVGLDPQTKLQASPN